MLGICNVDLAPAREVVFHLLTRLLLLVLEEVQVLRVLQVEVHRPVRSVEF